MEIWWAWGFLAKVKLSDLEKLIDRPKRVPYDS
jgi:hypothetical protein